MANELGSATLELETDSTAYKSGLQKAEQAAKEFGDTAAKNVDEAGDALDDAGKKAEGLGSKLTDVGKIAAGFAIGKGLTEIPGIMEGAIGLLDGAAVSTGNLQAKLGLTSDEAKELGGVAKSVFKDNFGESMEGVTDQLAAIQTALHLDPSDLKQVSEDMFRITDAFSEQGATTEGLTENIRSMSAAFPDMTQKEILDEITGGFQNGLGASGDYLDTLTEYPPAFAKLGLSADDMTDILNSGMKSGARSTDLVADAVKEFGIRVNTVGDTGQVAIQNMFGADKGNALLKQFAQGGDAARDAFFEVTKGLQSVQDPQDRYNAAVALFGTQAEDMAGALDQMDWDGISQGTETLSGDTATLDAQYAGLGGKIESVKRQFQVLAMDALGPVGPAMQTVATIGGGLGASVLSMMPGLIAVVPAIWSTTTAWIAEGIAMAAANIPLLLIIGGIALLVAGIVILVQNWDTITQKIPALGVAFDAVKAGIEVFLGWITGSFIPGVTKFYDSTSEWVGKAIDWVKAHWDEIKAPFEAFFGWITGSFIPAVTSIYDTVDEWVSKAIAFVKDHWDEIRAIIEPALEALVTIVKTEFEIIRTTVETAINLVKDVVNTVMALLKGDWQGAWDGVKSIVTDAWSGIKGVVSAAIQGIRDLAPDMLAAGSAVGNALMDGLKNALSSTGGFASDIGQAVLSAVKYVINTQVLNPLRNALNFTISVPFGPDIHVSAGQYIPTLAKGGIVDSPTLALIGEAGPEAVVPLDKSSQFGNNGTGNGVTVAFNGPVEIVASSKREAERGAGNVGWGVMAALRSRGYA